MKPRSAVDYIRNRIAERVPSVKPATGVTDSVPPGERESNGAHRWNVCVVGPTPTRTQSIPELARLDAIRYDFGTAPKIIGQN